MLDQARNMAENEHQIEGTPREKRLIKGSVIIFLFVFIGLLIPIVQTITFIVALRRYFEIKKLLKESKATSEEIAQMLLDARSRYAIAFSTPLVIYGVIFVYLLFFTEALT